MYLTSTVGRGGIKYLTPREGIKISSPRAEGARGRNFSTFPRGEVFYTSPPDCWGKAFLHSHLRAFSFFTLRLKYYYWLLVKLIENFIFFCQKGDFSWNWSKWSLNYPCFDGNFTFTFHTSTTIEVWIYFNYRWSMEILSRVGVWFPKIGVWNVNFTKFLKRVEVFSYLDTLLIRRSWSIKIHMFVPY